MEYDAIIVGGGEITGLTAAALSLKSRQSQYCLCEKEAGAMRGARQHL